MLYEQAHISDQDLVLFADGELSAKRGNHIRNHLAACWQCRVRMAEIDKAVADFVGLHQEGPEPPPIAGPHAMLKARLAEAAAENDARLAERFVLWMRPEATYKYAAAAMLFVSIAAGFVWNAMQQSYPAPQSRFTPGDTVPVTREELCRGQASTPSIPASLKKEVFNEYGISNPEPDAYEVDYLITPELGGATTIRNLWPQPYRNTAWNAHVKDQLEDRLHQMVCNGEIDLATAQHEIATDWVAAYKKYFRTHKPLKNGPRAAMPLELASTRNTR